MAIFQDLLSSAGTRGLGLGFGALGTILEWFNIEEQRRRDEARFREGTGITRGLLRTIPLELRGVYERIQELYDQVGVQTEKDIRGSLGPAVAQARQAAQASGLAGLFPGAAAQAGESVNRALGFFREQLASARVGAEASALTNVAQARANIGSALSQQILGYNEIPPFNPALAFSQLAFSAVPPPEPPKPKSTLFGDLLGGGTQLGSAAILAGSSSAYALPAAAAFAITPCLDIRTPLRTRGKFILLRDIKTGDLILNADGKWRTVVAKDMGTAPKWRWADFVELKCEKYPSIVLTRDHVINGKPAGSWKVGDRLSRANHIVRTQPHPPVPCGDILLDDGSEYMAGFGYRVSSMIVTHKDILEAKEEPGLKEEFLHVSLRTPDVASGPVYNKMKIRKGSCSSAE